MRRFRIKMRTFMNSTNRKMRLHYDNQEQKIKATKFIIQNG